MKQLLLQANKIALKYFCKSLDKSDKAKAYLFKRLQKETIQKFFLGYAPKRGLIDFLKKNNIEINTALKAGLIQLNDDKSPYEIFTNRIMFPVFNNGQVVGFGGRTIIDHDIKYLNSRETLLYNKGELLYILDYAKQPIHKLDYAIMVEGYFDVLSLIENKIRNDIGTCGTACREEHALLLRRWTDEVYTCFDGDKAGREAQVRAKKTLEHFNIYGGNMELPDAYDPDDFIKEFGKDKFLALKNS